MNLSRAVVLTLLVAQPAYPQAQKPKPAEAPSAREESPPKGPVQTVAEAPAGQLVNVKIELTITDQRSDAPPITKMVTMMASDRSWSRIRTQGDVRTPTGFRPVILNVDVRPTLMKTREEVRARLELAIEYRPVAGESESEKSTTPNINESLSVILEDGKPMLISQSADPVTDRKVKVEAKATILK
jgi:hypothetical protein